MKNLISQGLRLDQKVSKGLREAYETVTRRLRDDKTRNTSGTRVAREWLKYAAMFVMLFSIGIGNAWGASEEVTISTIASANSWTNGNHYSGWTSSSGKFTFTASNTGQGLYYSSDNSWRGYKSKGSMVITAGSGITISSVTSSASASWSVASGGGSASFTPTATIKFTSITITYTEAASCGVPTSPTNGTKTATTQPVSWTAPSSAPANGYVVAVCATNTAPSASITINNGAAYWSGNYYLAHIAAGTKNYTFNTASGPYLTAGTTYYWWVRSKCGASDYSAWVAGSAFTIPNIAVSTDEIDGMDYEYGSGPSSPAKTFTVSGTGLTGNLTVALDGGSSSDFEISKTSATSGFGYTLSLTQSSGSVSTTTIYVRLKEDKSVDTYVDNITISGGTATAQEVVIGGEVTAACANQVTLTKGAQANGTYTLSSANGSYDNCDVNFVVTVSSISPSSGYACTGVTATGGNSTVTGPDGSGNYTVTYTKGNTISSTVTANFAAKVATPTFSPTAGTYTGAQNVTISCETADATIYYTTNGSNPTTSSSVYSTPISVTQGTTIKAFATKAGMPNSDVATAAYVIRYTVSWSVNGTSYSSPVVVTAGSTTSMPADPTPSGDCAGLVFRGWTTAAIVGTQNSEPDPLFTGTTPAITDNVTFYAVFAEEY